MSRERYPRLTPMRAFALLLEVESHRDHEGKLPDYYAGRVVEVLASHVRSGLVKSRRRRRPR